MVSLPFNKKTLVFLGCLVVIIFFLIFLLLTRSAASPSPQPTPSPTPLLFQGDSNIIQEREALIKEQFPLLDFLPYQTKDFSIGYVGPLHLKISLFAEDQEAAKNEALSWIKGKGVNPQTHQVEWE